MKRFLELEKGVNFRELGGYETAKHQRTKAKKILRCGSMAYLTESDLAFLEDYGVRYVVDLRSDSEQEYAKDRVPKQAQYLSDSVYPMEHPLIKALGVVNYLKIVKDGLDFACESYLKMLVDPHANRAYRKLFWTLLENNHDKQSVVFHCVAGKDRTGIGAILLLKLLGVRDQDILQDFMLTNLFFADNTSVEEQNKLIEASNGDALAQKLNAYLGVRKEHFAFIMQVLDLLGGIEAYAAKYLQLTPDQIQKLKELYLEDVAIADAE